MHARILIFGARGFMGQRFLAMYPHAIQSDIDIADRTQVIEVLDKKKPDIVINCAGKTGKPNVDWCEDHKAETVHSNIVGPLILLEECSARDIYWVQMSTGCIYEGGDESIEARSRMYKNEGFTEDDIPNFIGSFYSRTKGWIDQILKEFPVLQLRLRMPFDGTVHNRNLITKLSRYPRVLDTVNSLTCIDDFLLATKSLIEKRKTGIYNIVNQGAISPYRVMELYREIVDPSHSFERLSLSDLSREVRAGRSNCILSISKLEREGIHLRPVEEAVRGALSQYKKNVLEMKAG